MMTTFNGVPVGMKLSGPLSTPSTRRPQQFGADGLHFSKPIAVDTVEISPARRRELNDAKQVARFVVRRLGLPLASASVQTLGSNPAEPEANPLESMGQAHPVQYQIVIQHTPDQDISTRLSHLRDDSGFTISPHAHGQGSTDFALHFDASIDPAFAHVAQREFPVFLHAVPNPAAES